MRGQVFGDHIEPPWPAGVASAFSPSAIAAQVALAARSVTMREQRSHRSSSMARHGVAIGC